MAEKKQEPNKDGNGQFKIESFSDLIHLNINTLEDVVNGEIDNKKAALLFTGSRTVTGQLKLGLEAKKLGMQKIGGVNIVDGFLLEK